MNKLQFYLHRCIYFAADLLDRIAADSVVKTYIHMVDDRIGELMSKISRKPDADQEEVMSKEVLY